MISVTGDTDTGKKIAQERPDRVKRLHLELGGKAPVIVFDDADLEARGSRTSRSSRTGTVARTPRPPCRVIAGPRIYERFVSDLADPGQDDQVGRPGRGRRHRDGLAHRQGPGRQGRGHGLPCRPRRRRGRDRGRRPPPGPPRCVLRADGHRRPAQDSEIVQDEVFGPVVTVQRFSDEDQAIKWANDVRFGLAASVWSADVGKALRVAKSIQFGTVWVNDHFTLVSEMPHGGFKESGYGKDQSMYAIEDYTVSSTS